MGSIQGLQKQREAALPIELYERGSRRRAHRIADLTPFRAPLWADAAFIHQAILEGVQGAQQLLAGAEGDGRAEARERADGRHAEGELLLRLFCPGRPFQSVERVAEQLAQ